MSRTRGTLSKSGVFVRAAGNFAKQFSGEYFEPQIHADSRRFPKQKFHLRESAFICGQKISPQFRNPEIISPVFGFSSVKPCGSVCLNSSGAGGLVPFKARAR